MKLSITTKSDTLFGTAGGGALIDSTTRHHPNGLPFIPAKTLKGLLKESAMEVLEMLDIGNKKNEKLLNGLFGEEGTGGEGDLSITSAEIKEANTLINDLQIEEYDISSDEVLDYFTSVRYQTQINHRTGTAKKGSLRSSRVLKPGNVFHVDIGELSEPQKALLYLACLNLRRAGTNRNRGMGKVEFRLKSSEFDPDQAIKLVKEYEKDNDIDPSDSKEEAPESLGKTSKEPREYLITLESPVLLPKSDVNRNTVSSEQYISGRKILGMLAAAYIRRYWKENKVYPEDSFKDLFLDGSVKYGPAFICENDELFYPLGHHWVKTKNKIKNKTKKEHQVLNDYCMVEYQTENTKKIGGNYSLKGNKAPGIRTLLDFHNSRNKSEETRLMGRNEGDGIFYYESLAPGQQFRTRISGHTDSLNLLEKLMDDPLRLGKSSNTQYGKVIMERDDKSKIKEHVPESDSNEVVLTFISPVLLRNRKTLEYDPSRKNLERSLENGTIKDARIRRESVVVYQGKIHMQLPEALAIAPGSSVKVSASREKIKEWITNGIGERTHEGYGRCIVETKEDLSKREDDNKRADIQKQVNRDGKEKEHEESREEDRLKELKNGDFKDHPFVRYLIYRDRLANVQSEAMKEAMEDAKEYLVEHKNTINTSIGFWKDVLMKEKSREGIDLQKMLKTNIENRFSKKVLINIANFLPLNKIKYDDLLNDEDERVIQKVIDHKLSLKKLSLRVLLPEKENAKISKIIGKILLEGFKQKTGFKEDDQRLMAEYWLRYFDVCKWKNRKSDEQ